MSGPRIPHPFSDEHFARSKGDSTINSLLGILGPPNQPYEFNVEDRLRREQFPLAQIYEGKTRYLESGLNMMVKQTHNSFVTQWLLPLVEYPDLNFMWYKWNFDRTLAPQTAPQAPPEYVQSTREAHRATMNRYELGTIMGAEEAKTEEGQFVLASNLINVAMSISETFEQMGIQEILNRKNHWRQRLRRYGEKVGNAEDVFAWEKATFDIIRKEPRGFYTLLEEVKKVMKDIIPTDVVMPEGTRSLIAADPAEQEYYRAGPEARRRVKQGGDSIGDVAPNPPSGLRYHVTREFTVDFNDGVTLKPLKRDITIGDHFRLDDFNADCMPHEYQTCYRNTLVFDMASGRGEFTLVTLEEGIRACERFNASDEGELSAAHADLARDVEGARQRTNLSLGPRGFADMFLYRSADGLSYEVARVFGHMEGEALSDDAVRAVSATFAARAREALTEDEHEHLRAGLRLIYNMYNKVLLDSTPGVEGAAGSAAADVAFMRLAVAGAEMGDDGVLKGNIFGGHNLPATVIAGGEYTNAIPGNIAAPLPPGYGNIPGIRTLAEAYRAGDPRLDNATGKAAANFDNALNHLHDVVSSVFRPDHPVLDAANVPAWFASGALGAEKVRQDSITTFAQNLLDHNKLPLYMTYAAGDDAPDLNDLMAAGRLQALGVKERDRAESTFGEAFAAVLGDAAPSMRPRVRATFTDEAKFAAFVAAYEQSSFSQAYVSNLLAADPLLSPDHSFAFFFAQENSRGPPAGFWANVINALVPYVLDPQDRRDRPQDVRAKLEAWSRGVDARARAELGRGARNLEEDAAELGFVMTHFSVAWQALKRANTAGGTIALASPFDVRQIIDVRTMNEETRRAFAQSSRDNATFLSAVSGTHRLVRGPRAAGGVADTAAAHREAVESRKRRFGAFATADGTGLGAAPSFAETLFADFSTRERRAGRPDARREGVLTVNTNLALRYAQFARETKDPLERVGALMLLTAPITREQLLSFCRHNVAVPVAILGERPLRRYETASLIFVRGGRELGEIAYSQLDTHLGANAMTKTFSFNVSIWAAAIIRHEEYTFIAEDVIQTAYYGGETTVPFKAHPNLEQLDRTQASVFYLMVPYGSLRGHNRVRKTHDLRGRFDADLVHGRLTRAALEVEVSQPHYPSALYYDSVFNFSGFKTPTLEDTDYFRSESARRENTVTHQGHQWLYNPKSGEFDRIIMATDHFGPNGAVEGHGELRTSGMSKHYKDANYQKRFVPVG
jgi:hypothetical protein